jgi:hypothetical protein
MLLLIAALILPGCAKFHKAATPEYPESYVTPVASYDADAHVCPINEFQAFTARHVAYDHNIFTDVITPRPMIFKTAEGKPGTILAEFYDMRRDLAMVATYGGEFSGWYPIAETVPEAGDRIWLQGYNVKDGMLTERFETVVLSPDIAGQLRFSGSPMGGSSGSCVLNEDNELVAVNTSYYPYRDGLDMGFIGSGVLVAGEWYKIPRNFMVITDETVELPEEPEPEALTLEEYLQEFFFKGEVITIE